MKNADQPANSHTEYYNTSTGIAVHGSFYGLTKREYFAALAMQAMIANPNSIRYDHFSTAHNAIEYADELLKQLDK